MHYNNRQGNDMVFIEDETDSFGNPDQILGFGNKRQEKKAAKKIAKGEKALASGNIKKAEKKFKKAQPILNKLQNAQQSSLALKQQQGDINATKSLLSSVDTKQTESMQTEPTQIGSMAAPTSMNATDAGLQSMSSGGGSGAGGIEEGVNEIPNGDEPTGDLANVKELKGVTVGNKKTNWFLIGAIGVVVVLLILFLPKLMKSKK